MLNNAVGVIDQPIRRFQALPQQKKRNSARIIQIFGRQKADAYFTIDPRGPEALFLGLQDELAEITGVYEPMCGGGHLAEAIKQQKVAVFARDLNNYGYYDQCGEEDFLQSHYLPIGCNSIFSNPPYKHPLSYMIIKHAIEITPEGGYVAMLMPFEWDAPAGRADLFDEHSCFYKKIVLPFRVWWFKRDPKDPDFKKKSPHKYHCWLVWKKGHRGGGKIVHLPKRHFLHGLEAEKEILEVGEYCVL